MATPQDSKEACRRDGLTSLLDRYLQERKSFRGINCSNFTENAKRRDFRKCHNSGEEGCLEEKDTKPTSCRSLSSPLSSKAKSNINVQSNSVSREDVINNDDIIVERLSQILDLSQNRQNKSSKKQKSYRSYKCNTFGQNPSTIITDKVSQIINSSRKRCSNADRLLAILESSRNSKNCNQSGRCCPLCSGAITQEEIDELATAVDVRNKVFDIIELAEKSRCVQEKSSSGLCCAVRRWLRAIYKDPSYLAWVLVVLLSLVILFLLYYGDEFNVVYSNPRSKKCGDKQPTRGWSWS